MNEVKEFLKNNPEYNVLNPRKLFQVIQSDLVTYEDVKRYLNKRNNIYGYKKKPFYKSFLKVASMSYTWQVDLMYIKKNIYFVAVEINSRFGYVKQIPSKEASKWIPCIQEIIALKKPCYKIIGDDEFRKSRQCRNICKHNNVKLYTVVSNKMHQYSGNILGYVDRFVKTLKWYNIKLNNTLRYIDNKRLPKIVEMYNKSPHSALNMYSKLLDRSYTSPNDVFDDYDFLIKIHTDKLNYNNRLRRKLLSGLKIGDKVRHLLPKDPNKLTHKQRIALSSDVYIIDDTSNTGYIIKNSRTNIINKKVFRPYELRKVTEDDSLELNPIVYNDDQVNQADGFENVSNASSRDSPNPNVRNRRNNNNNNIETANNYIRQIKNLTIKKINIWVETNYYKNAKILLVKPSGEDDDNTNVDNGVPNEFVIIDIKLPQKKVENVRITTEKFNIRNSDFGWNMTGV